MHVPTLADRVAALEDYFRFNAALPALDRELVIMATAREMRRATPGHDTRPEDARWARERRRSKRCAQRRVGATDGARAPARGNRPHATAHARVAGELYERGLAELGRQQLIETVALAGHYSLIGMVVNAFEVAPPDKSPTFFLLCFVVFVVGLEQRLIAA